MCRGGFCGDLEEGGEGVMFRRGTMLGRLPCRKIFLVAICGSLVNDTR